VWKHIALWLAASLAGLVGGFAAGPLLTFLALISVIGGPGFVTMLLAWSNDPRAFWYGFFAIALLALGLFYGLWGLKIVIFRLLGHNRGRA
jgi:hypothetical protein